MTFKEILLIFCVVLFLNISIIECKNVTSRKTTKKIETTTNKKTSNKNVKNFRKESDNEIKPTRKGGKEVKDLNELMSFDKWVKKYHKTYKNYVKSKAEAKKTFNENSKNIKAHNENRTKTYKQNLQSHSDLTYEEQKMFRMGLSEVSDEQQAEMNTSIDTPVVSSKSVNHSRWFPPPRDQGLCGSCYAFASVSILEYLSRKNGESEQFSEQNLIDCDAFNDGCEGGWPGHSLEYVRDQGISNGKVYTYKAVNQTCKRHEYPPIFNIEDVITYKLNGDEEKLKALLDEGPVVGAIGTTDGLTSYSSGVFYDEKCSSTVLDHAITIVGYGSEPKGGDYWLVRNSWGPDWGLNGYGMMARNRNNHCGIALYAIVPRPYEI